MNRMILALAIACLAMSPGAQAQEPVEAPNLPLSKSPSMNYVSTQPLSFAQQTARFEAQQRTMRIQWNNWIGYSPLRPNMNASYMSNGMQQYYIPHRGVIVSSGRMSAWYW